MSMAVSLTAVMTAVTDAGAAENKDEVLTLNSPDKRLELTFQLSGFGEPVYTLSFDGQRVLDESRMGFDIRHEGGVNDIQPFMHDWTIAQTNTVLHPSQMYEGFRIDSVRRTSVDYTWEPVWGEEKEIRDRHNEMAVYLWQQTGADSTDGRTIVVRFRLFDDGLGFRYEFPRQKTLGYFIIGNELTEFNLHEDLTAFWIAGDYDANEFMYETSHLSEMCTDPGHDEA